ncbi:MAG: GDP-perosamine synthase [Ignavibacterium sp.]
MQVNFIPVCEPFLDGNERKYILDAVESGWISSAGKYIAKFENAFAEYCGVKHGVAVCNGTAALHIALTALGIGKGDEVIIPNFTMIASAFSVCYTGAVPVFVDAEPATWNIDVNNIEEKITPKTKAIMAVHIYGHPCDMAPIIEIARKYNLKVIEDAAEVHGAEYKGKKCGNLGDISAFSFFANKIATTGEGGMVLTNDDGLAEKCRYYKNLCFPLDGQRNYIHNDIGFNYRMSNLHAAIGLAQVEKLEFYIQKRRRNNSLYKEYLKDVSGLTLQLEQKYAKNVYWMNGIIVNEKEFGMSRDTLMLKLKEKGIDTRLFFAGMHKQPALVDYGCNVSGDYPVSDYLEHNGCYLPSGSNLGENDIENICQQIKEIKK